MTRRFGTPWGPAFLALLVLVTAGTPVLWGQEAGADTGPVVASYPVHGGVLEGRAAEEHRRIWASIGAFVPGSLWGLVDTVELFLPPENLPEGAAATDGYASLNENGLTFTLGLNLDSARAAFLDRDPEALGEYRRTVLHEFGHVLALQASQRDESETVRGTLVIDEGTLVPGAYLNLFFDRFWKPSYPGRGPETTSDAEGSALYQKSPGAFVTEYAATGPLEDFAESFAVFVTEPLPTGTGLRDQKVRFFSGWPELVSLRDQVLRATRF